MIALAHGSLTPGGSPVVSDLHVIKLRFERFDVPVGDFEVLIELVALGDEVLFPLAEASLFRFDL